MTFWDDMSYILLEITMKNENDLRVRKTRENIRKSFLSLLKEKDAEKISVKEICDRAGCSRNTFYFHFSYRDALYQEIIEDCILSIQHGFRPNIKDISEVNENTINEFIDSIVTAIINEQETILALLSSKQKNDLYERLSDVIFECMIRNGDALSLTFDPKSNEIYRLYCQYATGGIVSFFLYWIQHKNIELQEAKDIFCSIHGQSTRIITDYLLTQT